jgi:hypothetical protein
MTLDELIEKLQAARTLTGGGAYVLTDSDYDGVGSRTQEISKVWVMGETVWIKYWR